MSDSIAVNQQLAESLALEVDGFKQFKEVLQSEQKALIAGDVDALSIFTTQKAVHADKLNALATARLQYIKTLGFTADKAGMLLWIKGAGSEPNALWKSLLALAAELQHLNNVNGKLIQTRMHITQQTLLTLLNAVNQAASLYGRSGQPDSSPQTSNIRGIIGKA